MDEMLCEEMKQAQRLNNPTNLCTIDVKICSFVPETDNLFRIYSNGKVWQYLYATWVNEENPVKT